MKLAAQLVVLIGLIAMLSSGCKESESPADTTRAAEPAAVAPVPVEASAFRGKSVPPGFPSDLLFLEGAEVYDGLSVNIDKGQVAYSLRYTVKSKLADVVAALQKSLADAKFTVDVETAGPRTSMSFKQGEAVQGKAHVLPTSNIDEVDVQVLLVK